MVWCFGEETNFCHTTYEPGTLPLKFLRCNDTPIAVEIRQTVVNQVQDVS